MKVFKEIFCRFWALWGLILFITTMIIVLPFYLCCFIIKEPAASHWHRSVSRVWMTLYLNLIACPIKVKGAQYYHEHKCFVVACNHNSLMDIPITTPFMPRANKTIGKKSFLYMPIFGWIYAAGSILIDRKSEKSRRESYKKMKWALSIGLDMVIYPEGTRNRTPNPLRPFYDGAFKLAVDTGKPIMPAILFNTRIALPPGKIFYLCPVRLEMHFMPSFQSTNCTSKELKDKVHTAMWNYIEANK